MSSPLFETAIPQARRWLAECISDHPSCGKKARHSSIFCTDNMHLINDLSGDGLVPSRLLVFPLRPSSPADDVVRVSSAASLSADTTYIALSHRWGEAETCKSTLASLDQLEKQGIPVADLPRTFRDAVLVARGLGFTHLWIDSLCIVQDDDEDWKNEATRMAIIYDNASCTIAAMDGVDSDSGLVVTEPGKRDVGVLTSRAWVCQEQMVAPRTLVFTNNSVAWECRDCDASLESPRFQTRRATEGTPSHPKDLFVLFRDWRLPPVEHEDDSSDSDSSETRDEDSSLTGGDIDADNDAPLVEGSQLSKLSGSVSKPGQDAPIGNYAQIVTDLLREPVDYLSFLAVWWQFISLYTPRRLTFGKDKFLAMNGITTVAQRWTHLRSSFGLWFHFMERELVWYVDPAGPPAERPSSWLAPSWTWAATQNGRVMNNYYRRLPIKPQLCLKPEIRTAVGTSFDQTLPMRAWRGTEFHSLELKGDLRKGTVTATRNPEGVVRYSVELEPLSRFSDYESHDFRPDCAADFPVGRSVDVICLLVWHYDAEQLDLPEYIDVRLVLRQARGPVGVSFLVDEVKKVDILDERTMKRVGYMETTYAVTAKRDQAGIFEDFSWFFVRLV